MKKIILYIAGMTAIVALVFMFSCQKENSPEERSIASAKLKENWLTAKLDAKFASSQKQVTAYLFPSDKIAALVKTPNVSSLRFVLGFQDNIIQISVVGVDKSGNNLGTVNSTVLKESGYDAKLAQLKEMSVSVTQKRTALLNAHLLLHKDAFAGITAWEEKLNSVSSLDEITSYEGARFHHFNLESAVLEAMVDEGIISNIGLFLGLNSKGKMTTVFIGLDENNDIKRTSATSKTADDVYDFSEPSPPSKGDAGS